MRRCVGASRISSMPRSTPSAISAPGHGRPGHEQFAQAATGMQRRFGGSGQPMIQPNPINDYGTGFMGAYAVALALLHRQRTGEGQHVDTALAYTAMMHQSPSCSSMRASVGTSPVGRTDWFGAAASCLSGARWLVVHRCTRVGRPHVVQRGRTVRDRSAIPRSPRAIPGRVLPGPPRGHPGRTA